MPVAPRSSAVTSSMEWLPLLGGGYGTTGTAVMEILQQGKLKVIIIFYVKYMKSVINTAGGLCSTLMAHYHKAGVTDFLPIRGGQWGGDLETAIVEIYENKRSSKPDVSSVQHDV